MWQIFSPQSPYTKRARFLAILWTLLILFLCFLPGNDIPDVTIPFADKWVHFILFGAFSFLWLCARPTKKMGGLLFWFIASIVFGALVELLQGLLSFLGRSMDVKDMAADAVGGLLGTILFYICFSIAAKKIAARQ